MPQVCTHVYTLTLPACPYLVPPDFIPCARRAIHAVPSFVPRPSQVWERDYAMPWCCMYTCVTLAYPLELVGHVWGKGHADSSMCDTITHRMIQLCTPVMTGSLSEVVECSDLCVTPVKLVAHYPSHVALPYGWEEAYTEDGRKYFIR